MAGTAEPAGELAGRLTRMSDDARVLSAALERLALKDSDQRDREKARRQREHDRERWRKTQRDTTDVPTEPAAVESAMKIAAEAAAGAADQATHTSLFINWAAPAVEDESEAEENEEEL